MIIPILIAVVVAAASVVVLMLIRTIKKQGAGSSVDEKIKKKGKSSIIKEAERKLAHDPHNVAALENLGDVYYTDKNWEKTWDIYKTLYDISAVHTEINIAKSALRMGIAAFYTQKKQEALNALMISVKKDPDSYEANYFLGRALYENGTYDKALICFKKTKILRPETNDANEFIAFSLFKLQKYRESLPFLKKVLEEQPNNKEILFDMAVAMSETGMGDKALKVFMHLRPDPVFGAQSCIEAGRVHERSRDYAAAIQDYEIGMKLVGVPEQNALLIKYRCANCYIQNKDISKGLALLKQIQVLKSGYKDVDSLVIRYSELNQNKNLQVYLLSGTSDFVALCRRFMAAYRKDAFVKVEDVQVASECVEFICEVESSKWSAKELYRFYRTQTAIGDIYIRDFHSKIRDSKCDNGVCVTMGCFSESCHKFSEGRPIDLVEKDELCKILKKINLLG